jgi:type II secretory pathway pseudopilin PulG
MAARLLERSRMARARGFTVIEAVVAAAIVITALGSVTQLVVLSRQTVTAARARSTATLLAVDKMEELRGRWPAASSPDSLDRDVDGFCDRRGVFTRRWSVRPLPSNPAAAVVVQVRVMSIDGVDTRLTTVRAARAD